MQPTRVDFVEHGWERFDEVLELYFVVLYRDFGVARDADWYHPAGGSRFAVASGDSGELLGAARLLPSEGDPSRQVRQVAVAPVAHGRGVGRAMMLAVEERARDEGALETWLNARNTAYGFYRRLGYDFDGGEFRSALTGIPHRTMRKLLG